MHWIHRGGRALDSIVRPYAYAIAGVPTRMIYNYETGVFHLTFTTTPDQSCELTEIYVPTLQFLDDNFDEDAYIDISDGKFEYEPFDKHGQARVLKYWHEKSRTRHTVEISREESNTAHPLGESHKSPLPQSEGFRRSSQHSTNSTTGISAMGSKSEGYKEPREVDAKIKKQSKKVSKFIDAASRGDNLTDWFLANPDLINTTCGFHLSGYTALHAAARAGKAATVKQLLTNKAKIDVKDFRGRTPLDWAKACSNNDCVALLQSGFAGD